VVSGWGIDGETAFQRGFPLKITLAQIVTPLEAANLGVSNVRPNVVQGCSKSAGGGHIAQWFNTSCFAAPPDWGFGTESRVDSTLRAPGTNNWDFAVFKRTSITERVGFEFRTEFFNLFNHPPFLPPATGFNGTASGNGFGQITGTVPFGAAAQERLIQFAAKLVF
jgi:hypothetical protein